jgi:small-conductance mechanosensitive channel
MNILSGNNIAVDIILRTSVLVIIFVVVLVIYRLVYRWMGKRVLRTSSTLDDNILKLFRTPLLWLLYWILLNFFISYLYKDYPFYHLLIRINNLLLIFIAAWLSIRFVDAVAIFLQSRYDLSIKDNLRARKSLTQVRVFKGIAVTIITILAIGAALMTFEQARRVGISILTSAGILGIIVGIAAQKSLGMILAGIQLAITQPVRLDDTVIVEGEFGSIEEIELTYIVVRIWDERRMIIPVTWFLEKPFQNLSRSGTGMMGTVFLYVDYSFPVESIRNILPGMLSNDSDWDGRVANIEITKATETYKEIRILLSSRDSSGSWNLRTKVREKLIDYINANYPGSFASIRIKTV